MRFKANELLEKAKKITDFQERNIYLDQSLEVIYFLFIKYFKIL